MTTHPSECAKPSCDAQALGAGRWPFLCAADALVLAGLRKPSAQAEGRRNALAVHEAIHRAFKAKGRQLTDWTAPEPLPRATNVAQADADTIAAVLALKAIGATLVRTDRRYGALPPTVRPIQVSDDPLNACELCGTISPRIKRAPYGVGDTVWVLCMAQAGCMSRLRASKGSTEEEEAA